MERNVMIPALLMLGALLLGGCGIFADTETAKTEAKVQESNVETKAAETETETISQNETETQSERLTESTTETQSDSETERATETESESETEAAEDTDAEFNGYRVTIDPGHSSVIASGTDPIGPGASEQKAKDSGGTTGCVSGVPEYALNLDLSFKLRDELLKRGYEVCMTRESNDVPMGNVERANVANDTKSDVFIRMHANGSEDSSVSGGMTICPTADNPYIGYMYEDCRYISDLILDHMMESAGISKGTVWETDIMTGSNWSQVPVTIVEVGYMSNADEDMKLQDEAYQDLLIKGIADGIDAYFAE